jgi:hypothetical protein
VREEAVHYHLTDIQLLLGGFTLVLVSIFVVAACLDGRWRRASRVRSFQSQLDSRLATPEPGFENRYGGNDPRTSYPELTDPEFDAKGGLVTFDSELERLEGD